MCSKNVILNSHFEGKPFIRKKQPKNARFGLMCFSGPGLLRFCGTIKGKRNMYNKTLERKGPEQRSVPVVNKTQARATKQLELKVTLKTDRDLVFTEKSRSTFKKNMMMNMYNKQN